MAKKTFSDIEGQNKNLSGVGALFTPNKVDNAIDKTEEDVEYIEMASYPLRMPKTYLKALKRLAITNDTSVKDLILTAIDEKWKI